MSSLNIVILAAGKGTRMCSELPKVLHKLAGKPLIQHVLDTSLKLDPACTCVVYGHGGEIVPQTLRQYAAQFIIQEPQLGTGHAVQQALPHLTDGTYTLILYGDVPLIQHRSLQQMMNTQSGLTLLTVQLDNPAGYGRIVRDCDENVLAIVEDKDATPQQRETKEINTGIMMAKTALLRDWLAKLNNNNAQGEYYLTDIVAMAVAQGVSIETVHPASRWEIEGINNKQQLATLERVWQHDLANQLMLQGVTLSDPSRIDIRGNLICGRDVEIDIGCTFEGRVTLQDNVKVGAHSIVRNSTIARGTQIEPYSYIDTSEVGANCHIGPYARLRPGSKLADDAHVGNFVEIKNSEIGQGSKANHLSYIGDSTVGSRVNIGAGTITCNYDGANKHRTVIEDDVFIGSDTQLVAPVRVGRGATIGAGSTITKEVPPGKLSLSRSKQISLSGWTRPKKGTK
ncbi:MAG: bifunctional UDP-N-acetylglucosamine diphosphorylase/glucosamine-1-phosphate N-acetyltransferase GlmU [Gallionella sp.]